METDVQLVRKILLQAGTKKFLANCKSMVEDFFLNNNYDTQNGI